MRLLPLVALLHRWSGLLLGAALLLLGLTGALLVFRPELTALKYPDQAARPPLAETAWPQRLDTIQARYGHQIRSVKTPRPGLDIWQIWLVEDGRVVLDGDTLAVLDAWHGAGEPIEFLFQLHNDLLAGDTGHTIVGGIGLAGAVMLVTGAVLWWPRRRSFSLSRLTPGANRRGPWLAAHWTAGIILLPLVLVPLLTGAGIVFHAQAKALLVAAAGEVPRLPPPPTATGPAGPVDWAAALATVRRTFPDGDIVFLSPPAVDGRPLSIRVRLPGEWHPNGRSTAALEPTTGALLQAVDANALSGGERLANSLYPVHAAAIGGLAVALVTAATGLGLAWLSAAGIWAWVRGRHRT